MKTRTILFFIIFFGSACTGKAQVRLQGGTPEFSLPIFDFADKVNRISVSISLNYAGGNGIKVNDIASDVGLGWELSSPGVIIRKQNGEPDDQKKMNTRTYVPWKGYFELGPWAPPPPQTEVRYLEELNKYIFGDGYLFNTINPETPIASSAAYVPGYEVQPGNSTLDVGFKPPLDQLHDREQDVFSFEFNGRKGSFIFSKTGEVKTLDDSRLKITPTFLDMSAADVRTQIKSFTITDEFGIRYVFNDNNLEELCTYKNTSSVQYQANGNPFPGPTYPVNPELPHIDTYDATPIGQFMISKWYLSDIINPMTNKRIHFEYDSYAVDCITAKDMTFVSVPATSLHKRISITYLRTKATEKRLKKIELPDGSFVQYEYNPNARIDLANANSLKKISINNAGHQLNRQFEYGYFIKKEIRNEGDPLSALEKKYARLCLRSVAKTGDNNSDGGIYRFDYFTGSGSSDVNDIVPPRLILQTDAYGYYNYLNVVELDPSQADHNYVYPNFYDLANYFNLTNYVTDARTRHQYSTQYRNGLLQRITNPYKGSLEFEYEPNLKFDDSQPDNNPYYGGARVAKTIEYDGISHANDIINGYKYIKPDGSCSIWGNDPSLINYFSTSTRQYKSPVTLKAGTVAREFAIDFAIAMCAQAGRQDGSSYLDATGNFAGKFIFGMLQSIIMTYLGYLFSPEYITTGFTNTTYYPLSFKDPLPMQFSRVEVKKGTSSLNTGKTVVEFTTDQDYPIDVPVYGFPFSNEYRSFNQAYGLTKKISLFNAANNKVKQTENFYNYKKNIINQTNYASQGWATQRTFSARYLDGILDINSIPADAIATKIYYPITGRAELARTVETVYDNNNDELVSSADYFYDQNNYLPARKETTDSKGRLIKSMSFYPEDYNLSAIPSLQEMVNRNIVNLPVSAETWQIKPGASPEMLSNAVTEYGLIGNGDYKAIKEFNLQSDRPVPQAQIGNFNPDQLVRNSSLIIPGSETVYNPAGNAVIIKDLQASKNTGTLYSYNNLFPIATILNGTPAEVAYTSFEAFDQGYIYDNNWDINNADIITDATPTGRRYCLLKAAPTQSLITTAIPINQDYKLSFWAAGNSFTINSGMSAAFSGPPINGWTYYEYNLPPGTATVRITGNNCKIDELRLYPKKSALVTTTYDIAVGKTAECDINNRITYYEYDGLGRISKVLDERRNIIKTYEYHLKN